MDNMNLQFKLHKVQDANWKWSVYTAVAYVTPS